MPDESGKEQGGLRGRIATVRGMLVAVGAVATALVAIIGLGRELLPDSSPRLRASIEPREVDRPVTLDEFLTLTERASTSEPGPRRPFVVASTTLAQDSDARPPERPPEDGQPPEEHDPREPRPEDGQPEEHDPPERPPEDGQPPEEHELREPRPEDGQGPEPDGQEPGGRQEPRSGGRGERPTSIDDFLRDVEPIIKAVKLPDSGEPADERRTEALAREILTGNRLARDEEVRRVLSGTRLRLLKEAKAAYTGESFQTRPVFSIYRLPPGQRERLEPRGAVVNFDIELEGYEGRPTELRWSLFNAKKRTRLPEPWLVKRLALRLIPDAPVDRATSEVWVPLPRKAKGPFFARLEVFDDKGGRLDYKESDPFR